MSYYPSQKSILKERRKRSQIRYIHNANFDNYIRRVLKSMSTDASISQPAVEIIDSILKSAFEDIGDVAKDMMVSNKKRTLDERTVESAVKVILPGELTRHAIAVGRQAMIIFREVVTTTPELITLSSEDSVIAL